MAAPEKAPDKATERTVENDCCWSAEMASSAPPAMMMPKRVPNGMAIR